ncbi:MAG: hypothetical protein V1914_04550 [archaeon]
MRIKLNVLSLEDFIRLNEYIARDENWIPNADELRDKELAYVYIKKIKEVDKHQMYWGVELEIKYEGLTKEEFSDLLDIIYHYKKEDEDY